MTSRLNRKNNTHTEDACNISRSENGSEDKKNLAAKLFFWKKDQTNSLPFVS